LVIKVNVKLGEVMSLCACGCGQEIKITWFNKNGTPRYIPKYIYGHSLRVNNATKFPEKYPEVIEKLKNTWKEKYKKGYVSPLKGRHHTSETLQKLKKFGETRIGKTYEEIYGIEKAEKIKLQKKEDHKKYHNQEVCNCSSCRSKRGDVPKHKKSCDCCICMARNGHSPYKGLSAEDGDNSVYHKVLKIRKKRMSGKNNTSWKGGIYPIKLYSWKATRKRALKRAGYKSEISGKNNDLLVHHIISRRKFCDFYFELMYNNILNKEEINKLLNHQIKNHKDRTFISEIYPVVLFEEMNEQDNLIVVTRSEHGKIEDKPPSFFSQLKNKNCFFNEEQKINISFNKLEIKYENDL
jgi:hypothetical protein